VTRLVRTGPPDDSGLDGLGARVAELERVLDTRAAEVTRVESDLAAFRIRYRREVGLLHEELDDLERAISEAELGEITRRLEGEDGSAGAASAPKPESTPRFTSDAIRRLFRDVAKTVHPDLARDERARHRGHALMIEANRAYAVGDEERLRSILLAWEQSPEAVRGSDDAATRERLARRAAQVEEQLRACAAALADLQNTPLWALKTMVDEAASRGKDLVGDMVRRLERDILVARNRLDAMQSSP
jgi:hypothetical protein